MRNNSNHVNTNFRYTAMNNFIHQTSGRSSKQQKTTKKLN